MRQYYLAKGEPQRTKAISREIAYHGVTLGALSFTGVRPMKEPFGAAPIPVVRVSNTNPYRADDGDDPAAMTKRLLDEMERTIVETGPETVAMVIAEPVQNAGGCLVPPDGYWAGLRELCDRYGIALVADEVITGFGRIGEWFAAPRFGATPDLITMAKGITSAYAPMGAVAVSDRIAEPLYEDGRMLLHGITYGGHPVAAAMALVQHRDLRARGRARERARATRRYLEQKLREVQERVPIVGDVRGAGYFWALELVARRGGHALLGRGARADAARLHHRPAARGGPDRPPGRPRRRRAAPRPAADQRAARSSTRWSPRRRPCWPTPRSASSTSR